MLLLMYSAMSTFGLIQLHITVASLQNSEKQWLQHQLGLKSTVLQHILLFFSLILFDFVSLMNSIARNSLHNIFFNYSLFPIIFSVFLEIFGLYLTCFYSFFYCKFLQQFLFYFMIHQILSYIVFILHSEFKTFPLICLWLKTIILLVLAYIQCFTLLYLINSLIM